MSRLIKRAEQLAEAQRQMDERLQWHAGALPFRIIKRITTDILYDLWDKCSQGDPRNPANAVQQQRQFEEELAELVRCATGKRVGIQFLGD